MMILLFNDLINKLYSDQLNYWNLRSASIFRLLKLVDSIITVMLSCFSVLHAHATVFSP